MPPTQHTLGPWKSEHTVTDPNELILGADDIPIALFFSGNERDAILASAAPDMLSALRVAEAFIAAYRARTIEGLSWALPSDYIAIDTCRRAIAIATPLDVETKATAQGRSSHGIQ